MKKFDLKDWDCLEDQLVFEYAIPNSFRITSNSVLWKQLFYGFSTFNNDWQSHWE